MKSLLLLFVLLGFLESCSQEDSLSYNECVVSLATVEQVVSSKDFLLKLDNDTVLYPVDNVVNTFEPVKLGRVLINYTILGKNQANGDYNYAIRLNDATNVVTKEITRFSDVLQDSLGNDPVNVSDCWIGSHFLNIAYSYYGANANHFISLVQIPSIVAGQDADINLELRHNAYGDNSKNLYHNVISFDLRSLQLINTLPVKLMLKVKNLKGADTVYSLVYK
ncbi:hypothetical protein [Microbacter margulisiae]|uniref:NigD-like protein n=1 Tax=Microbacter margulisiae TaxID=1350067 RepID=A0A7W5DPI6_9PORP|nr:NigD-like C-terminal domain-containing protein [Microbacter margulisiae]MBB3186405.1 hypothetical protein [Microbacter margulisiae]